MEKKKDEAMEGDKYLDEALWSRIIKNPDVVLGHSLIRSLIPSHRSLTPELTENE